MPIRHSRKGNTVRLQPQAPLLRGCSVPITTTPCFWPAKGPTELRTVFHFHVVRCGPAEQTFKKQVGPLSSSRARVKNGLGQARTRLGVAGLISGSHRTIFRPYSSLSSNRIPCSHRFPQSPITIIKRILLPVRPPLRGRAAIPLPQTPAFHRTFGRIRRPSVDPIPSHPIPGEHTRHHPWAIVNRLSSGQSPSAAVASTPTPL